MTDSSRTEQTGAALIAQFRDTFFRENPGDDLYEHIFDRPALLWDERWPELEAFAAGQAEGPREAALAAVALLKSLAESLAGQGGWFEGGGPVERLAAQVVAGLMTEEEARLAVTGPDINLRLSPDYVERMAGRASYRARNGQWQEAVPFSRLLVAGAEAYPPGTARETMRRHAIFEWIETATRACGEVPDGAIFSDAKARGLQLLGEWEAAGDQDAGAEALFRLGVLHLDPYQGGRNLDNIRAELGRWRQRFIDLYGSAALAADGREMPDALEAAEAASAYLEKSAALRQGVDRGFSLKARADALLLIEKLGGPANRELLRECVEEALALIPEDRFPALVATLHGRLRFLGVAAAAGPGGTSEIETLDPAAQIAELGYLKAVEHYKAAANNSVESDPDGAVRLVLRLWPYLHEREKAELAQVLIRAILKKGGMDVLLARHGGDYAAAVAEITTYPPDAQLTGLAALAARSTGDAREGEAIGAAERAALLSAQIAPEMTEAMQLLHAWVLIGAAVNGAKAERWQGTTQHYCDALRILTLADALAAASDLLEPAADAAVNEGDDGIAIMSVTLASLTPRLIRADLPRLGDHVHEVWIRIFAQMLAAGSIKPVLYNIQIQAVKGASFAAMLHNGTSYDARSDPVAMDLLGRRASIGASEGLDDVMLNEYVLIAHHVEPAPQGGPVGAVERLAQRFDAHVVRRMIGDEEPLQAYLFEEEWSDLLDPSDLLLNQYLGSDERGGLAFVTSVHSKDGVRLTAGKDNLPEEGGLPIKYLQLTVKDRALEANVFGLTVASLREELQGEPGPAIATDEAIDGLSTVSNYLAGALPILRDEQALGRNHLCFVPHGPYHFCPLHLVPADGGILADNWTVTYLPHPALLRRRGPLAPASGGMAAFGLGFAGGEMGCPPLPGAVDEARTVASLMGGKAWIDGDATEQRLAESLATCRYVHIATHGQQNAFAPMLQRLSMAPSPETDGIYHAYEVLGLDLHHLDLITLSACETALGRFDINDNLRGLVATLLIAGARTVISTLWPVRDSVAKAFFETLYARIAAGDGKLAAFRAAQVATRATYRAYRDWGAFVYVGCW